MARPTAGAELGLAANRALRGNSPDRDAKPPQHRMAPKVVSPQEYLKPAETPVNRLYAVDGAGALI